MLASTLAAQEDAGARPRRSEKRTQRILLHAFTSMRGQLSRKCGRRSLRPCHMCWRGMRKSVAGFVKRRDYKRPTCEMHLQYVRFRQKCRRATHQKRNRFWRYRKGLYGFVRLIFDSPIIIIFSMTFLLKARIRRWYAWPREGALCLKRPKQSKRSGTGAALEASDTA